MGPPSERRCVSAVGNAKMIAKVPGPPCPPQRDYRQLHVSHEIL